MHMKNSKSKMREYIILVDPSDKKIGLAEKILVHQYAMLHRAFSILIYRKCKGKIEFLLQKRNKNKYHTGGLWTNTCCGHLHANEKISLAAKKRLQEEMGLSLTLKKIGVFHYVAALKNKLYENEIDHVFIGELNDDKINFNKSEVEDYCWISPISLKKMLLIHPQRYTPWLAQVLKLALTHIKK